MAPLLVASAPTFRLKPLLFSVPPLLIVSVPTVGPEGSATVKGRARIAVSVGCGTPCGVQVVAVVQLVLATEVNDVGTVIEAVAVPLSTTASADAAPPALAVKVAVAVPLF